MRHDNKIQVAFLAEPLWSTLCKTHWSLTLKNEPSILLEHTLKQISLSKSQIYLKNDNLTLFKKHIVAPEDNLKKKSSSEQEPNTSKLLALTKDAYKATLFYGED